MENVENVDLSFISRQNAERLSNRIDTDLSFHLNITAPYLRYVDDSLGSLKSNIEELPQDA